MQQQQRMAIVKDLVKKIRSKGRGEGKMKKKEEESQGKTTSGKIWKMALPYFDSGAELVLYLCCSSKLGVRRESESAGCHYRVGCGGRHFRQKPSGGTEGTAPERVEAVKRG